MQCWLLNVENLFSFFFRNGDAFMRNDVTNIFNLLEAELALLGIYGEFAFSQLEKDFSQVLKKLFFFSSS